MECTVWSLTPKTPRRLYIWRVVPRFEWILVGLSGAKTCFSNEALTIQAKGSHNNTSKLLSLQWNGRSGLYKLVARRMSMGFSSPGDVIMTSYLRKKYSCHTIPCSLTKELHSVAQSTMARTTTPKDTTYPK